MKTLSITKLTYGLISALALLLIVMFLIAGPASASGKNCYSDSTASVQAGHVSCPVAMRVLHAAADAYRVHGFGSYRVRVNGIWRCYTGRIRHTVSTVCKRNSAFVVIVVAS